MTIIKQESSPNASVDLVGPPISQRIDPAHAIAGSQRDEASIALDEIPPEPPPSAEELAAAAGVDADLAPDRLRAQARQLAGHLRAKQRDLDRREAEMNALVAKIENEQRASRLWLREKEYEYSEREAALQKTLAELDERAAGMSVVEISVDRDLEEARRTARRLEEQERKFAERERRFRQSEAMLEEHTAQLASDRRQLDAEREKYARELHEERKVLARRESQSEAELEARRKVLEQRCEALDGREESVEQLQSDVTKMHREALELRLVTEQLWAQLAGTAAPAELTQSMGRIRARIADHYRLAEENLTKQREELRQLAAKLDRRQHDLRQQRADLQSWLDNREEEIEEQAERLVTREQELDRQERHFRQVEQKLSAERREQQQELRRLMSQIRASEPAVC